MGQFELTYCKKKKGRYISVQDIITNTNTLFKLLQQSLFYSILEFCNKLQEDNITQQMQNSFIMILKQFTNVYKIIARILNPWGASHDFKTDINSSRFIWKLQKVLSQRYINHQDLFCCCIAIPKYNTSEKETRLSALHDHLSQMW